MLPPPACLRRRTRTAFAPHGGTSFARALVAALGLAGALSFAGRASAFSYESAVTDGCHERITLDALRLVRADVSTALPIEPDRDERALIDDLPFTLGPDVSDLAAATLVIGVRDNDLKGRGPLSIDQLSEVHGDPETQREHCLRHPSQDEIGGSDPALAECRAFIRERARQALDGLDENGVPDPDARISLPLDLAIRGGVDASLPHFWVRIGQALHALEDGFSHTYRSADGLRVTTVLNFIEVADGVHDEARDGPAHKSELDRCDDADDLKTRNRQLAVEASAALLRAALDPALDRAGKEQAIDATLTKYLSYEPGCTFADGWCDAPEGKYPAGRACGCSVVGDGSGERSLGLVALAGVLLAARRARRARRGVARRSRAPSASKATFALGVAALLVASPSAARAQEAPPAPPPPAAASADLAPAAAAPGATVAEEAEAKADAKDLEPQPTQAVGEAPRVVARGVTVDEAKDERKESQRSPFALFAAVSGSFDNPGAAAGLGLRLQLSDAWAVGVDGEFNPFYGVQSGTWRTGAFNGFGTLIYRVPMRFEAVNLRTTAHAGVSVLLMDLYGAPKGTLGPYFGVSPLGLEWKLSRAFYVIIDPVNIALPVPQTAGAIFAYPQYRLTIGLEFAP